MYCKIEKFCNIENARIKTTMIEVKRSELIDGEIYLIEEFNPDGTSKRMRGKCSTFSKYLYRFDDVIRYQKGKIISYSWFHTPRMTQHTNKHHHHWKYYVPVDKNLKNRIEKSDIVVVLLKMLLHRQMYSNYIGDTSTIQGLIQNK